MPQYQVPQFIEIESPIVGPLTLRQFMWFAGAGGIAIIMYFILTPIYFIVALILLMGLAAVLAFIKVEGKPFISYLINLVSFSLKPQILFWETPMTKASYDFDTIKKSQEPAKKAEEIKRLSQSKIQDLAWRLDLGQEEYQDEENKTS